MITQTVRVHNPDGFGKVRSDFEIYKDIMTLASLSTNSPFLPKTPAARSPDILRRTSSAATDLE